MNSKKESVILAGKNDHRVCNLTVQK